MKGFYLILVAMLIIGLSDASHAISFYVEVSVKLQRDRFFLCAEDPPSFVFETPLRLAVSEGNRGVSYVTAVDSAASESGCVYISGLYELISMDARPEEFRVTGISGARRIRFVLERTCLDGTCQVRQVESEYVGTFRVDRSGQNHGKSEDTQTPPPKKPGH